MEVGLQKYILLTLFAFLTMAGQRCWASAGLAVSSENEQVNEPIIIESLIDPTRPIMKSGSNQGELKKMLNLTGIIVRDQTFEAIIDGNRVKVGDQLGDITVTRIERGKVYYTRANKSGRLLLRPVLSIEPAVGE